VLRLLKVNSSRKVLKWKNLSPYTEGNIRYYKQLGKCEKFCKCFRLYTANICCSLTLQRFSDVCEFLKITCAADVVLCHGTKNMWRAGSCVFGCHRWQRRLQKRSEFWLVVNTITSNDLNMCHVIDEWLGTASEIDEGYVVGRQQVRGSVCLAKMSYSSRNLQKEKRLCWIIWVLCRMFS
jgi:hypothetical protein